MRFLYIAPRYHTNQVPIIEGLIKDGHEVMFLSHYVRNMENYNCITPIVVGYSPLSDLLLGIIGRIMRWSPEQLSHRKILCGFPSCHKLRKYIKDFQPDFAILRERSVYTIFATRICKRLKIPAILYNQSPLWEEQIKNDILHRLVRRLTPKRRITPVLGIESTAKMMEPGASFVPFVMPPLLSPEQKQYHSDGLLKILCIGKYEERKNHLMLIEAISELKNDSQIDIHLTISGECTSKAHHHYLEKIEKTIADRKLNENITLYKNLTREEIFREYQKADLFVIPSTLEPASISQLEAMAHSLPVICSDTNGSASYYVEDGVNGYIFADNHKESLKEALSKVFENPAKIPVMGAAGYDIIANKCCFQIYFDSIMEIAKDINEKGASYDQ